MSWSGGNMPQTRELGYNYVYKKSSFTVLAFTILTFAVTWGMASAFASTIGAGVVGGSVIAGGITPLAAGAIGAGLYAGKVHDFCSTIQNHCRISRFAGSRHY
jgi:hypothetical protein